VPSHRGVLVQDRHLLINGVSNVGEGGRPACVHPLKLQRQLTAKVKVARGVGWVNGVVMAQPGRDLREDELVVHGQVNKRAVAA
jgi:hypothetical protein